MRDTYAALGDVLAAAYANGDSLVAGIDPDEGSDGRRGLRIKRDGYTIGIRANQSEPRFRIDLVLPFSPMLRDSYDQAEIEAAAPPEFDPCSDDERSEVIDSMVRADLERVDGHFQEYAQRIKQLKPVRPEVVHLTYRETDLWEGILLIEQFNPYEEFSQYRYDEIMHSITSVADQIQPILANLFDTAVDRDGEALPGEQPVVADGSRGFQ